MTDPACRNAGLKRPRTVRVGDSARDANDLIQRMMGDGPDSGLPPGAAPNPFLQPRDEVGDAKSELRSWPGIYEQFAICLHLVYIQFTHC